MAKKGNLCPGCETEIVETNTGPEIVNTYLAGRDLCADVICPECGKIVNIYGRKIMTSDHDALAAGRDAETDEDDAADDEGDGWGEDDRGNAEKREGESHADAEGRATAAAAMRASAERHADEVNSGDRDPGAKGGDC